MPTEPPDDPRRILALLWGSPTATRPGPKPGLDIERIVRAAIDVADREGLSALSMRRVAAELGVGQASLYTYVAGRRDLTALMLDTIAGHSSFPHTFAGDWREKFEAWAVQDWEEFHRHPWVLQLTTGRILPGPNLLAWYDSALQVLTETPLEDAERLAAIEAVDAYVRGLAWTSVGEGSASTPARDPDGTWEERRDAAMGELVDFGRLPNLTRVLQSGHGRDSGATFRQGLAYVLDGIEAQIARRSGA